MHFRGGICICRSTDRRLTVHAMKIAKPLLMVSTPLGMVTGIKILIVLVLAAIVGSLGKALFVLLMLAWYFGGIAPHGVG
jgi:hypothetical protein